MSIINSATYQFVALSPDSLPHLQATLYAKASALALKGTILLSPEGINLSLAGTYQAIQQFKATLASLSYFNEFRYNDSYSTGQPFQRLFVKIKKQIIAYANNQSPLNQATAPYITPETLCDWLAEKKEITLIDTRNHYEVQDGTFENALSFNLKHFRDFPTHALRLQPDLRNQTVVTFCTGGIRCEKAATTLLDQGFKKVYQLKGGILSYFKYCGNQYYQGGCFVFDDRGSLTPQDTVK